MSMKVKAFPAGATHQHKNTFQFFKVDRNRVFRIGSEGTWVASTVTREELKYRGEALEDVASA
ncbi:hypothetical protein [Amphritea sp. HPY]|uniref:hypothetical protein n=1 Tax=Amphritea sp. HPY TaxID=3421652 RepID=UPI003D7CAE3A